MAHRVLNGVSQLATGTGVSALALDTATAPRYQTMAVAGMTNGDTAYVRIEHSTIEDEWEYVLVTYSADSITRTFDSNSFSPTDGLINFSAGDKIVTVPISSEQTVTIDPVGNLSRPITLTVADLAALKALISRPSSVIVKASEGAGTWQWVADDSTTADDVLVVQCASGAAGRYKRIFDAIHADYTIILNDLVGVDVTGVSDSAAVINAILADREDSGCKLIVPRDAKITLASDVVLLNAKQSLVGSSNPHDASGIEGFDYTQLSSQIILASEAEIRLDNGAQIEGLLIYRDGLSFNTSQGDFSAWVGNGIVLGYGNDQVVRNCMVLGFEYPVRTILDRGLNGPGRVILDRVYVDGVNGFRLNGSYDTAFLDRLRAFPFVTAAYNGTPAGGEFYDPRKDRRPGIGFNLVDRSDGTKIGSLQVFGWHTGFKANTASWMAASLIVDYPTTPTYTSAGTGSIGLHLIADEDPTSDPPRNTDYDPCQIGSLQAWSFETPIKIEGNAGRVAQIGAGSIVNAYGDGIQIDGGGLICTNMRFALVSGAPVTFLSQPNTKSTIHGWAVQFGPSRNSFAVPVVSAPAGSDIGLIDVKLASDQADGSDYFDNFPTFQEVASASPLTLPTSRGSEIETYVVTGTTNFAGMYGKRPGAVRLHFASGLTIFAGAFSGGFNLPGAAESLVVAAGGVITFEYNGAADRWVVVATNA